MNQKSHKLKTYYSNSLAQNTFQNKKELLMTCVSELKTPMFMEQKISNPFTIFFNMTNFFRNMPSLRKTKLIIDADFGKA